MTTQKIHRQQPPSFRYYCCPLISILLLSTAMYAHAEAGTLWLNPAEVTIPAQWNTEITVQLDGVTGVYGMQISLNYNAQIVTVIDTDPQQPGVQVLPGSCPQPDFVVANDADNTLGTIDYAVTQLSPTPPCDGGDVATMTFQCVAPSGSSPVSFTQSIISDPNGLPIDHITQNNQIICEEAYQTFLPILLKRQTN